MKKYLLALGFVILAAAGVFAGPSIFQIYQGGTGQSSFSAGLLRSSGTALSSAELSGDATTSGSNAVTLASVVTPGSCGDTTHSCGLTYNAKGLITAATNNVISGGGGGGGTVGATPVWAEADVAASRVAGTVYQNTSGNAMIVCIGGTSGSLVNENLLADSSNPPTTQIASSSSRYSGGAAAYLCGMVLNSQFYKLTGTGVSVAQWQEYTITKGSVTDSGDVVGSRSFTTVYQNTTGHVIWVAAQFSGTTAGTFTMFSDSSSSPTTEVYITDLNTSGQNLMAFVPVLNGNYYKITTSGTSSLLHWHEYQWTLVTAAQNIVAANGINNVNVSGTPIYRLNLSSSVWTRVSGGCNTTSTLIMVRSIYTAYTTILSPSSSAEAGGDSTANSIYRSVAVGLNPSEVYGPYVDAGTLSIRDWAEYSFQ